MDDGSIHNLYHEPGPSRFLLEHLRYLAAMECMLDPAFMKKKQHLAIDGIFPWLYTGFWIHPRPGGRISLINSRFLMHLTWSALVWHCNDTNALVRTGHWKRTL